MISMGKAAPSSQMPPDVRHDAKESLDAATSPSGLMLMQAAVIMGKFLFL
jgi:hypothetical protein